MPPLALVFLFILGSIVGSFLNVFVLRRGTGRSLGGRSHCASCGVKLAGTDLVPIASYVALGGRCRTCKSSLPLFYPLVETATGIMFVLIGAHFSFIIPPISSFLLPLILFCIHILFWSLALAIVLYDLRHTIIPDTWVYWLSGLGAFSSVVFLWGDWKGIISNLSGGLIFGVFFFVLWLISRGRWMGLGDAKIAFAFGIFLGLGKIFSAWALSFWTGAVVVLLIAFADSVMRRYGRSLSKDGKPLTMRSEIPFGPFLFLGSFLAYLGAVIPLHGF